MKLEDGILAETNGYGICAIIITYNPDIIVLGQTINSVYGQVSSVMVVNNSSDSIYLKFEPENLDIIALGENKGIAFAQNIGIKWAVANGFSHVLLMDQDSKCCSDMVSSLLRTEMTLSQNGELVAAVGPKVIDSRDGYAIPYLVNENGKIDRKSCGDEKCMRVGHLIASGSLIRLDRISEIGLMEDDLFIDFVDIEWCMRAWGKGYSCFVNCNSVMEHALGDNVRKMPFSNRRLQIYSPIRFYYQFRNLLLLYRRDYVYPGWVSYTLTRHLVAKFFVCCLYVPKRLQVLKMIVRGGWDGLLNRSGPYGATAKIAPK